MDDRFPFMIIDWLSGEQLRSVLTAAEEIDFRKLCVNLGDGKCVGYLAKADLDMRYFLEDPNSLEIADMPYWESVAGGDGIYALTLIYLRLWLNGKLGGWKDCCEAHNQLSTNQGDERSGQSMIACRTAFSKSYCAPG